MDGLKNIDVMSRMLLVLLFSCTAAPAFNQVLTIDEHTDEKILYLHELEYLVDSTNTLAFPEISDSLFRKKNLSEMIRIKTRTFLLMFRIG